MTEIEVKILEINREEVEKKLLDLGAKKTFEGEMVALMFDFEGETLIKERKLLRLRKEGEKITFTFKQTKDDETAKVADEFETEVGNFEEMKQILEGLGLKVFVKTRKQRTIYQLGDVHFAIDNYEDELEKIPEFLEIEAPSLEEIDKFASELGFSKEDYKTWGLGGLTRHYGIATDLIH